MSNTTSAHDFTLKTIDGKDQPLSEYRGKPFPSVLCCA
jgi:hypothetical protein